MSAAFAFRRPGSGSFNAARALVVGVAGIAALWGAQTIWDRISIGADLTAVSSRILQDRAYDLQRLRTIYARTTDSCSHAFARGIIQLRIYEQSAGAELPTTGEERTRLERDIRASGQCDPNEAFFPLVTAAFTLADGHDDAFFLAIRQSYRSAPFENWIALRRSLLMLTHFAGLPDDLRRAAEAEFVNLVNSGLHREAAAIFDESGLDAQAALLDALQKSAEPSLHGAFLTRLIQRRAGPKPRFKRSRRLIENFSLPSGTSLQRSE